MFFLTLNIIDEMMGENDRLKVTEMRNTATRFYYMLVMQVRRYLSEGKFTSSGQVPIIRAMDMRMVAEKIQRICEFLESIDGVENKKQLELASLIRDFYARAYSCFINEDFEKALPLYNEAKLLIKKYEPGDSSDIKSMDAAICLRTVRLLRILRYSIEISKLVR